MKLTRTDVSFPEQVLRKMFRGFRKNNKFSKIFLSISL